MDFSEVVKALFGIFTEKLLQKMLFRPSKDTVLPPHSISPAMQKILFRHPKQYLLPKKKCVTFSGARSVAP